MFNFKIENYFKLIFIVSLITIISALYIEHILGHQPCNLCLLQRIPYGLSIILIVFNHFFKKYENFIVILLALIFVFSLMISAYHFGIESGFFQESIVCKLRSISEILTKEQLLEQLSEKTVSCKDVTFRIFGLSLTSINMFLSLFLIIFSIRTFKNYEKFKKYS